VNFLSLFLTALGLAIFLEGLPYFISPNGLRAYVKRIEAMSDAGLRGIGLSMMILGLIVVYSTTR